MNASLGSSFERHGLAGISLAVMLFWLVLPGMAFDEEKGRMAMHDLLQRGKELRSEIEKRYEELKTSRTLIIGVKGNDITERVKRYVPYGTSFDSAEEILRSAGFTVYPRPAADQQGKWPDGYDVTAVIKQLDRGSLGAVEVIVILTPKAPGDYSRVNGVDAGIFCTSL